LVQKPINRNELAAAIVPTETLVAGAPPVRPMAKIA